MSPTTPSIQRSQAITHRGFRLFPFRSPLLLESLLFSFRSVTKMFQFTDFPSQRLFYSSKDFRVQTLKGFPIRNSRDQRVLAPTPSLSQLYTSFIGCQYQGIHRKLFVALPEWYIIEIFHTINLCISRMKTKRLLWVSR